MKPIIFLGSPKKTHILLYLAKILSAMNKKVLVIDGTTKKHMQHHTNAMNITLFEFKGFDVGVWFNSYKEALPYTNEYDVVLIDIDNKDFIDGLVDVENIVLVNQFDITMVQENEVLIHAIREVAKDNHLLVDHIIYGTEGIVKFEAILPVGTEDGEQYVISVDEVDEAVHVYNQHFAELTFKRLSKNFLAILGHILTDQLSEDSREIGRAIRSLRKI